jgi:hypothetical protein
MFEKEGVIERIEELEGFLEKKGELEKTVEAILARQNTWEQKLCEAVESRKKRKNDSRFVTDLSLGSKINQLTPLLKSSSDYVATPHPSSSVSMKPAKKAVRKLTDVGIKKGGGRGGDGSKDS